MYVQIFYAAPKHLTSMRVFFETRQVKRKKYPLGIVKEFLAYKSIHTHMHDSRYKNPPDCPASPLHEEYILSSWRGGGREGGQAVSIGGAKRGGREKKRGSVFLSPSLPPLSREIRADFFRRARFQFSRTPRCIVVGSSFARLSLSLCPGSRLVFPLVESIYYLSSRDRTIPSFPYIVTDCLLETRLGDLDGVADATPPSASDSASFSTSERSSRIGPAAPILPKPRRNRVKSVVDESAISIAVLAYMCFIRMCVGARVCMYKVTYRRRIGYVMMREGSGNDGGHDGFRRERRARRLARANYYYCSRGDLTFDR